MNDNQPIVVERIYNAPIHKVWQALTDVKLMKQWYFDVPDFKPEPGCEFSFMGGTEEHQYKHLCRVTEAIVDKKISYTWRYDGYEGNSEVSFELFAVGDDKTKLVLTHTGLDTFPPVKDFAKSNFAGGWDHIINTGLKEFLEK